MTLKWDELCVFMCTSVLVLYTTKENQGFVLFFLFFFLQNIVCNYDPNYIIRIKYMEFEPVSNNVTRF